MAFAIQSMAPIWRSFCGLEMKQLTPGECKGTFVERALSGLNTRGRTFARAKPENDKTMSVCASKNNPLTVLSHPPTA